MLSVGDFYAPGHVTGRLDVLGGAADSKLYAWSQSPVELIVESSKKFLKRSEVRPTGSAQFYSMGGRHAVDRFPCRSQSC